MFTRRQRKPPKGGYQSPLMVLMKAAQEATAKAGVARMPADAWIRAAEHYLTLQRCCQAVPETVTAAGVVDEMLELAGFTRRWEGADLVIELPGWAPPPPPSKVAVQPRLFD